MDLPWWRQTRQKGVQRCRGHRYTMALCNPGQVSAVPFCVSASPARGDGRARIEHEKGPIEADAAAAGICGREP